MDAPGGPKKLQSQFFRPIQKSCDWSVTKCMFFVFQKYFGQPPFWTFLGHVAYMLRVWQHFTQCPKMSILRGGRESTGFIKNIRILNEIFSAEKVSFQMNSHGSNQDFYEKTRFQTKYFRP
jgi:hypothetical protein